MLTERTSQILVHIIGEYVETAQPVGSETMVRKYRLPISAATVRNEMARLEEEGYISHPHTSAGRIPSDKGYRYYVESLMEEEEPSEDEKRAIGRRFFRVAQRADSGLDPLEEWVRLAAAVIAESLRNAVVATVPRPPQCRLQHLEIVSLDQGRALLIVVFLGAHVRQRQISLPEPADQEQLAALAGRLSDIYGGLTPAQVRADQTPLSPMERHIPDLVVELMAVEEQSLFDEAYLGGMLHIFNQPEFSQMDVALEMLAVLQEGNLPKAIPFDSLPGEGVLVVIGGENRQDPLRRCSVVLTRYGTPGAATGALAVLGPTRMRYSRVIPAVRYLSSLMGERVAQLC